MRTAVVDVRRRALVGPVFGAAPVRLRFEESDDEITWSACEGAGPGGETAVEADEARFVVRVGRRRFRVRPLPGDGVDEIHVDVRFDDAA